MKQTIVLLFLFTQYYLIAQQIKKPQFNKWTFSNNCEINFNSGSPVFSSNGASFSIETSGGICDQNGNTLFYSDGDAIYNANHNSMPSSAIWKSNSVRMGPLAVPTIGNTNRYWVFQVDGSSTSTFTGPLGKWDGLYYHIINMSLNGGQGDIMGGIQNVSLVDSTAEAVIAIMHENGEDFWVITRKAHSNNFYSFLVTKTGVCTTPVISSVGSTAPYTVGLLKLTPSHDGNQIASAESSAFAQLFDFDKCSGKLSNPQNIGTISRKHYDVAFSPNDSLIYLTHFEGTTTNPTMLQYRRFSSNIPATENVIGGGIPWGVYPNLIGYTGMRVYGDTIYVGNADSSFHILADPNNYGNPDLQTHWLYTGQYGARVSYNFPNYFDYEFQNKSYTAIRDTSICGGDSLEIGGNINCNSVDYTYAWSPSAGLNDHTTSNPIANPNVTTTYVVSVTFLCNTTTDTITINVLPCLDDTTICLSDSVTLIANGTLNYSWVDISNMSNILYVGNVFTSAPTTTTTYAVFDSFDTSYVTVTVLPKPQATIISDSVYCANDPVIDLEATNTLGLWSGSGITSSVNGTFDPSLALIGNNLITYEIGGLCSDIDSLNIVINQYPFVSYDITDDICDLSVGAIDLSVMGGSEPYTFIWSNGLFSEDIEGIQSGNYSVLVIDNIGCSYEESILVENFQDCLNDRLLVFVPNAFTPGLSDGINDEFGPIISGSSLSRYEFYIFNRWGEVIFKSSKIENSWNGTSNGTLSPLGVYVWRMVIVEEGLPNLHEYTGHVLLLN